MLHPSKDPTVPPLLSPSLSLHTHDYLLPSLHYWGLLLSHVGLSGSCLRTAAVLWLHWDCLAQLHRSPFLCCLPMLCSSLHTSIRTKPTSERGSQRWLVSWSTEIQYLNNYWMYNHQYKYPRTTENESNENNLSYLLNSSSSICH